MESGSILESIGSEIIGVISLVSICMFLVVLLVYTLSSSSNSSSDPIGTAANLVYVETSSDSTTQKLEGSLLNALVFVILIAAVTFLSVVSRGNQGGRSALVMLVGGVSDSESVEVEMVARGEGSRNRNSGEEYTSV
ncbi:hypothetical protein POM88_018134 [Heracleum sosnowskyi]|uniref:Uncharacterized protein n=1 Tax=Heracleum sosnowskyi TaxID=360622 RepID=A0AAD8MYV0_9APIA|nr:hypothetical protein POM88_018134 [Heracleum sosnowskyi]